MYNPLHLFIHNNKTLYESQRFICEDVTEFKCNECNRLFKSIKSLRSHQNHHNSKYAKKFKETVKLGYKSANLKQKNKEKSLQNKNKYNINPKSCKNCDQIILFKKRENLFCNSSCSAQYNNKHRILNSYVKKSNNLTYNEIKTKNRENYIKSPKYCVVCSVSLLWDRRHKVSCGSPDCLKVRMEQGKIKARENNFFRKTKRSKTEIKLFELCKLHFDNCLPNHIIADGWDADIVLPDYKIAIMWNGPWHYMQVHKNHSLKQVQNRDKIKMKLFSKLGWQVLVYEDRYYTIESAFNDIKNCAERIQTSISG